MFIIDAHLDLAMNAMEWNRDMRKPVEELRAIEKAKGWTDKPDRGNSTVSLPALRKGNIGLVVATQIARYVSPESNLSGWCSPEQAWAQTQAQLAWYRSMEEEGEMIMIKDLDGFEKHLTLWNNQNHTSSTKIPTLTPHTPNHTLLPIGYILSLEGADSIVTLAHLERAYNYGLRALGPAHYGPGRYANGTNATGKMQQNGINLLREMDRLKMILDATHLCDDAFWQAMDHFHGPVWASHHNCRALVDHNRQFSDEQLKLLIQRGAIIGAAMDAWMIVPHWVRGQSTPQNMDCSLSKLIDHIDHICQLAGSSLHVCIGTDLDGGYGNEQCPYDIDTIADTYKLGDLFKQRGYSDDDVANLMHGNFIRFIRRNWK